MEVLNNIKEAIRLLEENTDAIEGLSETRSLCDRKVDYWLHKIELETIPVTEAYKIIKEIKKQRNIRRECKNALEILKVFEDNEGKMCNTNNRKILLNQVCKTANKQANAKYSYDAYTDEELAEIFGYKLEKDVEEKEDVI